MEQEPWDENQSEEHRVSTIINNAGEIEVDRKETGKLRRLLFEDFTMFLLNNILMSVQFFENYERDVADIRHRCLEESNLETTQFKSFEADEIHRLVATKVLFLKKKADNKIIPELLHPLRTYITYQNVELAYSSSLVCVKSIPNKPSYNLVVQRCEDDEKEVSGYVNLIEPPSSDDKYEPTFTPSIIYHPDNTPKSSKEDFDAIQKKIQAGVVLAKNDNFYCLDPKKRSKSYPLKTYRTHEHIAQAAALPKSCFKEYDKETNANKLRRKGMLGSTERSQTVSKQNILISAAFKRHFAEVFAAKLFEKMNFSKAEVDSATFRLDHITLEKHGITYQIFPVLKMNEWPEGATDFNIQGATNKKRIEWPTKIMKHAIKTAGCNLLPVGYCETNNTNSDYTLEWKIEFPKAESYLMLHMMHTHIRCYLFALILYKTYIETELTTLHFGPSHIANLLYLMVGKDFMAWPECSQGETLIKFLKILHGTLQKKDLKSFFFHKRNLYSNSPLQVLHRVQTIIMRILQNPIPYILKALMNLKYKDEFYSHLDYLKLYNILTVKDLKQYLNPTLAKPVKGRKKVIEAPKVVERKFINEEEQLLAQNGPILREAVLLLFINHFIEIANCSRRFKANEYSMLYLCHAKRLTTILSEESISRAEINELFRRIKNSMANCNMSIPNEDELSPSRILQKNTNKVNNMGNVKEFKPKNEINIIINSKAEGNKKKDTDDDNEEVMQTKL